MAHNLNYNAKRKTHSFYSRKELPWHGLGQFIDEAETASQALVMANLDYEVKSREVFANFVPRGLTARKIETIDGWAFVDSNGDVKEISNKKNARIPGYQCIYRDDTKDVFDIVSDRYEIVQNFESLDIIYGIIKGPSITDKEQIIIQTAGCLNKGETVFVTAKMPSYMIRTDSGEDIVDKYIVFTTSHNKSAPLTALVTDVRVVCNNTLNMALRSKNRVSMKHTKNVRDNFNQFSELLGVSNKYSREAKMVLETLAQSTVTSEQVRNYVYDMFVPDDKREFIVRKDNKIELVSSEYISTRLKNKVTDALSFMTAGAGQEIAEGTAYWMYNGMTSYIHNGLDFKSIEERFTGLIGGTTEALVKKSFDLVTKYV